MTTEICASFLCDAISLVMTTIQLGQFIPQHLEMVEDRTVQGVSPWLLFFNSLYTFLAAVDFVLTTPLIPLLPPNQTLYRSLILLQPHLQMIGSAILSSAMWYWYLSYYENEPEETTKEKEEASDEQLEHQHQQQQQHHSQMDIFPNLTPTIVFTSLVSICVFISFASVILSATYPEHVPNFAHVCGILAVPLNGLMWLPQVILTLTYGHKGALSLPWVVASCIVDVIFSAYLILLHMHWSVWINNVPDAIFTAILSFIVLHYNSIDRASGLDEFGHPIRHQAHQHQQQQQKQEIIPLLVHSHSNTALRPQHSVSSVSVSSSSSSASASASASASSRKYYSYGNESLKNP